MGLLSNVSWMSDAKCVDEDHKIFISYDENDLIEAKKVCSPCEVKFECMDSYFDVTCVAGGLSYFERLTQLWREIEDVNESNWRNPNYLLRQYRRK